MDGFIVGVFGSEASARSSFLEAVAKKSEAEGLAVYTRVSAGTRYSLLDAPDYPEKVQTCARVASMADHALLFIPPGGRLSASDGELAVLLSSFSVPGRIELLDDSTTPEGARALFKGTSVGNFKAERREPGSGAVDLSGVAMRPDFAQPGTLVSVDRAFTVKGVGTVVLGFVLSGEVKVHQQLRLIPGPQGASADVKGIQVNDVDVVSAGRGMRVGLSLRGTDPAQLDGTHWLDDGTFATSSSMDVDLSVSPYYRQEIESKDLHVQLPGEILPGRVTKEGGVAKVTAASEFPLWHGMRFVVVDLNGKGLRIAGGGTCKL